MAAEAQLTYQAANDYSIHLRLPYHFGIFLATNAIPDAYAVIDGPDCVFRKAEWIHGRHDWNSTLMDVLGNHRVVTTLMNAERVIKDKGDDLATRLKQVGELPDASVAFICSMPHVMIIGTQYDRLVRVAQGQTRCRLLELPSRSLDSDWLHGYDEALNAMALDIDLSGAERDPRKVALVGYFMDRTEQDHAANVRELERLIAGIGLELNCVWLENKPYANLAAVKDAGTIVTLPLGRRAGRTLARRTGAELVEAEVPFGTARTERFLRAVARAAGCPERVAPFVERELARLVPRLEWVIPHVFLGKRVAFSGTPDLFGGMLDIAEEVGMEVALLHSWDDGHYQEKDLAADFGKLPPIFHAPRANELKAQLRGETRIDLCIGGSHFQSEVLGRRAHPTMEFGFPSHFAHALYERPFLGYEGWMSFLDQMARVLARPA